MKRFIGALSGAALALGGATTLGLPGSAQAQLFDPYIISMMAGPVSDGPSVLLLKKRAEKFMSPDTVIIACSAGAVAGMVAHSLPALAGVAAPLTAVALLGTGLFGCAIGAGGGATAIGTQWLLNLAKGQSAPPQ